VAASSLTLLNLGCGPTAPHGWINIDRSPNVLLDRVRPLKWALFWAGVLSESQMAPWPRNIRRINIKKGLPFANGTVDGIYSSHTLEHLYLNDARNVLIECARVLRRGAVLRLALPNAAEMAKDLVLALEEGSKDAGIRYNEALAVFPTTAPSLTGKLLAPFSGPPHRWQPTEDLVHRLLCEAGFPIVVWHDYRAGDLPGLADVEYREESLFVEARH
jgi:SAM-dependent methyltransferase